MWILKEEEDGLGCHEGQGSSGTFLRCCSCNLSSQRKPDLVGYCEIYQGWQGNPGVETFGSWVLEVAVLDLFLKRGNELWPKSYAELRSCEVRNHVHWWVCCPFCSTTLDLKTAIEMERLSVIACC